MKELLAFLGALLGLIFGNHQITQQTNPIITNDHIKSEQVETVILGDKSYFIYRQKFNPQNISLIANFSEKNTSAEIIQTNNCKYGANAGFYTPEGRPLGYFINQNQIINTPKIQSNLINGYVYKTRDGNMEINSEIPTTELEFAFQSGPIFYLSSNLKIIDDKSARRIVLGQTKDEIYMLALVDQNNAHEGPRLTDLPAILSQSEIQFIKMINLDGGAASAFYSDNGSVLSEITPVGAFLCGK